MRERSLPPQCNRRRVGEEEDKRSLPLCFLDVVSLTYSGIFYSLCAAVVFPTFGFSTLISSVSSLCTFAFSLYSDFIHTSKVRLWPNELGDLFLTNTTSHLR